MFFHWKLHFMMLMEQCNYVGQWDRTILISWTISSFDINTHNVTCHQVRGRLYTSQNRFSFFGCVSNSRISRPVSLSVCLSHLSISSVMMPCQRVRLHHYDIMSAQFRSISVSKCSHWINIKTLKNPIFRNYRPFWPCLSLSSSGHR